MYKIFRPKHITVIRFFSFCPVDFVSILNVFCICLCEEMHCFNSSQSYTKCIPDLKILNFWFVWVLIQGMIFIHCLYKMKFCCTVSIKKKKKAFDWILMLHAVVLKWMPLEENIVMGFQIPTDILFLRQKDKLLWQIQTVVRRCLKG